MLIGVEDIRHSSVERNVSHWRDADINVRRACGYRSEVIQVGIDFIEFFREPVTRFTGLT